MTSKIAEDPRIDPRIRAMFANMSTVTPRDVTSREEVLAMVRSGELAPMTSSDAHDAIYEAIAPSTGLTITTRKIVSQPDGNIINLQVVTPGGSGPFPCVYYIHGGGMMMASCYDTNFRAWCRLIASFGVAVVAVDFRNSVFPSSVPEVAPFPAALNDCVSGLRWVHAHAKELNIDASRIVVEGESGGGNLSLATAMTLKRDGDLALIKGVYVQCPYLAGQWSSDPASSVVRNAEVTIMDARASFIPVAYGVEALRARNPLAWPGFAGVEDVAGFPPVVIVVNECDQLRDDGVNFYRLLLRAGVPARCRELIGTVHATEILMLSCPEISRDGARDIAAFCAEQAGNQTHA
jgi:acetyl esterase/lipase